MKTKQVLDFFEGPKNVAEALTKNGVPATSSAVSQWGVNPPMSRQYQIQEITNGELKVEKPSAA